MPRWRELLVKSLGKIRDGMKYVMLEPHKVPITRLEALVPSCCAYWLLVVHSCFLLEDCLGPMGTASAESYAHFLDWLPAPIPICLPHSPSPENTFFKIHLSEFPISDSKKHDLRYHLGLNCVPRKKHGHILQLGTCECDRTWK